MSEKCPKCFSKLMVTPKGSAVCVSCNYTGKASTDLIKKEDQNREQQRKKEEQERERRKQEEEQRKQEQNKAPVYPIKPIEGQSANEDSRRIIQLLEKIEGNTTATEKAATYVKRVLMIFVFISFFQGCLNIILSDA
jgi:uncharacterized Zn finger protein (UPF0148 family)